MLLDYRIVRGIGRGIFSGPKLASENLGLYTGQYGNQGTSKMSMGEGAHINDEYHVEALIIRD